MGKTPVGEAIWTLEGEIPESLMAAGHELRRAVDDEMGRASFHGNMIMDLDNWRSVNPFMYPANPLSSTDKRKAP
jgi:hypothetical protein